jgi:hypothetical protein
MRVVMDGIMHSMRELTVTIWSWIVSNPVQDVIILWVIFNVIWAQWRPASPTAQRYWDWFHKVFQLVVTSAEEKGTFRLPFVVEVLARNLPPNDESRPSSSSSKKPPEP